MPIGQSVRTPHVPPVAAFHRSGDHINLPSIAVSDRRVVRGVDPAKRVPWYDATRYAMVITGATDASSQAWGGLIGGPSGTVFVSEQPPTLRQSGTMHVAMLRVCKGTGGQHRHKGLSALKFFQRCRSFGFPEYWSKKMPGTVQHEIASYITKRVPSQRLGSHSAKSTVDPQGRRRPIKAHYTMCTVKGTPGSPLLRGDGGFETQEAFLFVASLC